MRPHEHLDAALEALTAAGVPPDKLRGAAGAVLRRPVHSGAVAEWSRALADRRLALSRLLLSPGIPQRTPEWYRARETLVTASDLQKLLDSGADAYCRRKAESAGAWDHLGRQPAIRWGKKHEPVAAEVYARRTLSRVHEFGLLLHPALPGFGASPDGITSDGVMLEIKCPFTRTLQPGQVPRAYYAQIQGQLDTAGLDLCDYFEARLGEYRGEHQFLADAPPGPSADDCLTAAGLEKGAMFLPGGAGDDEWVVCPESASAEAVAAWARERRLQDPAGQATFWYVADTNLVRVRRDPDFMAAARPLVSRCREILTSSLADRRANPTEPETPPPPAAPALPSFAFVGLQSLARPEEQDGLGANRGGPSGGGGRLKPGGLPSFAFL